MRKLILNLVLGLIGISTLALTISPIQSAEQVKIIHENPHVTIVAGGGYGSGTSIGNGYFVTAAHVVTDNTGEIIRQVFIKTEANTVITGYVVAVDSLDVAIIRIIPTPEHLLSFPVVNIDCDGATVGTKLKLYGSSGELHYIYMNGEIVGERQSYYSTHWPEVMPVDGMIIWGMSGGGALNEAGDLVGINVAIHFSGDLPIPGIGYIVPSDVVCNVIKANGYDLS